MDDIRPLIQQLYHDIQSGEVHLPAIPELTFRIRKSLYDDRVNIQTLSRLIQLDSTLSTRLIQIANSAAYRGSGAIRDCYTAINHLGLTVTRNVVTSLTLKNAYQRQRNQEINQLVKTAWIRSCHTGALAHVLATVNIGIAPDQAMLAGMLHNIGILPLVDYLERYPQLITPYSLRQLSLRFQGELGSILLKYWKFDEVFIEIPRKSNNIQYNSTNPQATLIDLIIIARVHLHITQSNRTEMMAKLEQMPAYHKLSISKLGIGASLELIHEAEDEIKALMQSLR